MAKTPRRRRAANRYPKARRHKTGQLCADFNGKTRYFGKADDPASERAFNAYVAAWIAAGRKPINPPAKADHFNDPGPSVAQVAVEFRDWAKATFCAEGEYSSEYVVIERITRVFKAPNPIGVIPASAFSPRHFHEIRDRYIQERYTRSTINRMMHRVKRMFKWAVERERVPLETWSRLALIKSIPRGAAGVRERPRVQPVPDADYEKTLPHLKPHLRAVVVILRRTGARVGEICQLKPNLVDRSGDVWTFKPPRHKALAFHERVIHFGPLAREALEPFLKGVADDEYVFRSRQARTNQRCLRGEDINKSVAKACKRAGVASWHVHRLRHARLHELRQAGLLDSAQAVAGHTTQQQTEWYAQLNFKKAEDAARNSG